MAAELKPWSCVYSDCSAKIEEASRQLINEFSVSCPECGRDQANVRDPGRSTTDSHGDQQQETVKPQAGFPETIRNSTNDQQVGNRNSSHTFKAITRSL